jgi:hypothetical protein
MEPSHDPGGAIVMETMTEDERMSQGVHRVEVIRRLLDAGLSAATLRAMLPEFVVVIDELAEPAHAEDAHLANAR